MCCNKIAFYPFIIYSRLQKVRRRYYNTFTYIELRTYHYFLEYCKSLSFVSVVYIYIGKVHMSNVPFGNFKPNAKKLKLIPYPSQSFFQQFAVAKVFMT